MEPKVFIGGQWLDVDGTDYEEFIGLYGDAVEDYEDIPEVFVVDGTLKPELWDWLELSDTNRETVAAYVNAMGVQSLGGFEVGDALEAAVQQVDDFKEFLVTLFIETNQMSDTVTSYLDEDAIYNDYRHDYIYDEDSGWVFHNV